ncbi:Hypothetical predicted protein [Mytilus galloprovincialis]|uniref:Uncharacterized protein n=1 Tax=Mytilus galloprovincialis TaxID=29158 RepID=A0A8B6F067_MYTGA|nr:Hypothetical predicted protein [Mytilus galloprovincialis]
MVALVIQERETMNRVITQSQIHFDEGDILVIQTSSSRLISPTSNPPPYSELVAIGHIDPTDENGHPTDENE